MKPSPGESWQLGIKKGFFIFLILSVGIPAARANAGGASGYDLVAEVNAYRVQMGTYELNYDAQIAAAAQKHAEWIVETGNGGHTGAGGTDETQRVMAAGYGNGKTVHCDEAWAQTSSVEAAVYTAWSDWTHQAVMLDYWGNGYTDAGGGVASSGSGIYVFVFDICLISGHASAKAATAVYTPAYDANGNLMQPTEDTSQWIMDVKISAPEADGSIIHIVDYGQTLYSIASAYGTTVNAIRELNYMADDQTDIYVGEKLLIKKADKSITGTPAGTSAATPATGIPGATATLAHTFTPRPRPTSILVKPTLRFSETVTPTSAAQSTPLNSPRSIGMVLITFCGVGLAAFLLFSAKKE